jgi:hypothetical protein
MVQPEPPKVATNAYCLFDYFMIHFTVQHFFIVIVLVSGTVTKLVNYTKLAAGRNLVLNLVRSSMYYSSVVQLYTGDSFKILFHLGCVRPASSFSEIGAFII